MKMKLKMMLLALPLAPGATVLYAGDPQTGVINRDTLEAPIRAALVSPQGYQGGEFAPAPLK
jgi:hypothetical protein